MSLDQKRCLNVNIWHKNENINKNTDRVYNVYKHNTGRRSRLGHFWVMMSQKLLVIWNRCVNGALPVKTRNVVVCVNSAFFNLPVKLFQ